MEVRNKKLILKDYVSGFPKESDMDVISSEKICLKLPEDSKGVLIKNLFLAADPHLRPLMKKVDNSSVLQSFTPGSVSFLHDLKFSSTFICLVSFEIK